MEKKKLNILLIGAAVVLWGLVLFRLGDYFLGSEQKFVQQTTPVRKNTAALPEADSFHLLLNYRDPFLGGRLSEEKPRPMVKKTFVRKPPIAPPPEIPVYWPEIKLKGIIKNKNSKNNLALLQINGTEALLKAGESVEEVKLVRIQEKEVTLQLQKETKTFTVEKPIKGKP